MIEINVKQEVIYKLMLHSVVYIFFVVGTFDTDRMYFVIMTKRKNSHFRISKDDWKADIIKFFDNKSTHCVEVMVLRWCMVIE